MEQKLEENDNKSSEQPISAEKLEKLVSTKAIKIQADKVKVKYEVKDKGNKSGRMKVTFKLNKAEAEGVNMFIQASKPDNLAHGDYLRYIFFIGLKEVQNTITKQVAEIKEKDPEKYAEAMAKAKAMMEEEGITQDESTDTNIEVL